MPDVTISYKNTNIATLSATGTKTLLTEGKYCEDDIVVSYAKPAPSLETVTKTYTPSTSQQTETITPSTGYDGIGEVDVTVNAMPSGTAGTPTATKGTVSGHAISVTPSVTNTTGYITGGTKTGTAVSVSASELVSGTKTISAAGTTDVTNYASVSVAEGSATIPATSISADPTISVDTTTGLVTASVSQTEIVSPSITEGYISASSPSLTGISVTGSSTSQLSTRAGATIAPTEGVQTAVAANKYTLGDVKIGAISSSYVGTAVPRRTASDATRVGNSLVMLSGYYSSNVTATIQTDTIVTNSTWSLDANNILVM